MRVNKACRHLLLVLCDRVCICVGNNNILDLRK